MSSIKEDEPLRRLIQSPDLGWVECFRKKPSTPPQTDRKRRRDESCTWRHDQSTDICRFIEAQTPPPGLTPWGDVWDKHSVTHASRHIPEAQDAFKGLMIHWILQFALRIAFRCVLHRCGSQDIRR